jgi:hypothetical protein
VLGLVTLAEFEVWKPEQSEAAEEALARPIVAFVAKTWKVHPLTQGVLSTAKQRLFRVSDPDRPDRVFTLRVSHADGERVFDRLLDEGGSIDVEFDDVVEVVDQNPAPDRSGT